VHSRFAKTVRVAVNSEHDTHFVRIAKAEALSRLNGTDGFTLSVREGHVCIEEDLQGGADPAALLLAGIRRRHRRPDAELMHGEERIGRVADRTGRGLRRVV
jgi:hypothetical protein